ncbi:MAG: helix-turn-helix domain-containing protein [Phycisphaerales bacterium]|nr:helix-turn-helix domain-containing protein [Phycisphaerales bacterium]
MFANNYAGMVPPEILELIARRVRYYRIRADELDDLQQQIVPLLMEFRYDPAIANGASETTAMTAVIDNQIKVHKRSNRRHQRRIERMQTQVRESTTDPTVDLRLDMERTLMQLSPQDRAICQHLAQGHSTTDIAQRLNCCRATVDHAVRRVRQVFEEAGLQIWIDPNYAPNEAKTEEEK